MAAKKISLIKLKIDLEGLKDFKGLTKQLTDLNKYYKEINRKRCKFNLFYPVRFIYSLILYPFI